jgi:hypothetical protein
VKRRSVIAVVGAAGVTLVAGLYRFTDLFVKHYPPTPYDDLLTRLIDRDQAIKLGRRMTDHFDVGQQAARLRATFASQDLTTAIQADIAAGRLIEMDGWVMPDTLARLSALAAKTTTART